MDRPSVRITERRAFTVWIAGDEFIVDHYLRGDEAPVIHVSRRWPALSPQGRLPKPSELERDSTRAIASSLVTWIQVQCPAVGKVSVDTWSQ
jgi:hypothetical protein